MNCNYSLIKLIRATTADTGHVPFTYDIEVHSMNGDCRLDSNVKEQTKSNLYGKELKMTGKCNHAVRLLNQFNWTVISEDRYNELKKTWTERFNKE